jgi:hypothetical protein
VAKSATPAAAPKKETVVISNVSELFQEMVKQNTYTDILDVVLRYLK